MTSTRARLRWLPLAVAFLTAGACAQDGPGTEVDGVVVRDSAGIEIVESAGPGELGPLEPLEVLRLGVRDAAGPEQFSQVHAVALGPEGQVVVGNNGTGTVRIFDETGSFVAEVAGRGAGPTEVERINRLTVGDGVVAVADWPRGKSVLFTFSGEHLETLTSANFGLPGLTLLGHGPSGWLASATPSQGPPTLSPGELWVDSMDVFLLDLERRTVAGLVFTVPRLMLYGLSGPAPLGWGLIPEGWHLGFDAEGFGYLTHPHAYRVDVLDDGVLVRSIRRSHELRPLTAEDVEEIQAAGVHTIDTMSAIPEAERSRARDRMAETLAEKASLPLPAHVPPIGRVLVSRDGSFWVERVDQLPLPEFAMSATFGSWGRVPPHGGVWDLHDPDGMFLGSIHLPPRFRPEAVRGLDVVGVFADDLDIEYVVRYRAVPSRE